MQVRARLNRACRPASGPGPALEYCGGRGHNRVLAWLERRILAAAQTGARGPADTDNPVTLAEAGATELFRLLHPEADRVADIADRLREAAASP
jgi:hypothetical protein